jgi:hypothetical protein
LWDILEEEEELDNEISNKGAIEEYILRCEKPIPQIDEPFRGEGGAVDKIE